MKYIIHKMPEKFDVSNNKKGLSEEEARNKLQHLKFEKERVLAHLKAIQKSHWYGINGLPEQREKDLEKVQKSFYQVCANINKLTSIIYRAPLDLSLNPLKIKKNENKIF